MRIFFTFLNLRGIQCELFDSATSVWHLILLWFAYYSVILEVIVCCPLQSVKHVNKDTHVLSWPSDGLTVQSGIEASSSGGLLRI